ncbi:37S ribosomal protein S9, mitochondrial [Grifola frondosa]|uniref:37S ribosomal protein S9, mitochondrial n=1 Tax=Grifola frondosa TaxID=5627 RepID=A0A1C7LTF2_GRIFR|nr:37S ribosomal protein S9, mitochondrial [Grifola frondosa]
MNIAKQMMGGALRRTYATAPYVPAASLEGMQRRYNGPPTKSKPESPTFYTARSSYYDEVISLESAIHQTRSALRTLQLLNLPKFARDSLPPLQPVWKTKLALNEDLSTKLSTARYRRVIDLLNELNDYRNVAQTAGCEGLAAAIQSMLDNFEPENKEAVLARGKRKPVTFDEYGRTYTVGRRKESSARVWVIAVQPPPEEPAAAPPLSAVAQSVSDEASAPVDNAASSSVDLVPETSGPLSFTLPPTPVKVTTTNILINNTPLHQYFPLLSDRERVIRPFKIAGLLGAYNVFALARGGGTTGQSGAVSLGIAKALAAHVPDVEVLLRRAKLLRRDPRMVERKKTGRAKARKAYTWVKR